MVNYANTQLYELIEHDTQGNPVVYRGYTTQPLHQRLSKHRTDFKLWKEGKFHYVSSFEVLKHGPARIELVRSVCCFNIKEASRAEGLFIRELPTCVNILKNYETRVEHYNANKETILAKNSAYNQANKEKMNAYIKAYRDANRDTILAQKAEKVTCECGVVSNRSHMARHQKSWRHFHNFIHM